MSIGILSRPDLTDDGLHPNTAGYAVMAPLAEAAITRVLGQRPAAGNIVRRSR